MFDKEKVATIDKISKEEKWPFPKILDELKNQGIDYYLTQVVTLETRYFAGNASSRVGHGNPGTKLEIAPEFNESSIQELVKNYLQEGPNFNEFLENLAKAGVKFFRVDVVHRSATFSGGKPGESHLQKVA